MNIFSYWAIRVRLLMEVEKLSLPTGFPRI
jgi:hypothetical protein